MNEIAADHTIYFFNGSGERETFDFDRLLQRMEQALHASGTPDAELAAEIAVAVESAIRNRIEEEPDSLLRESDIDNMVIRILENIGQCKAAVTFRATAASRTYQVDTAKINDLLAQEFPESAGVRELTAKKIYHTLLSIGAESASSSLIFELAKHFLLTAETKQLPPVVPNLSPDAAVLPGNMILSELNDPSAEELLRKGVIQFDSIDLRVFPVLRVSIRISAWGENLTPPLTELALCPAIIRTADAIDTICLAADRVCRKRGHDSDTPLKLILRFSDAVSFTELFMDCNDVQAEHDCIHSIATLLCNNLSRKPLKILFS